MDNTIDLHYLLRGYMAGSLSHGEKLALFTFLENKENVKEWNALIERLYEEAAADSADYQAGNLEEMIAFILRYPVRAEPVTPIRRLGGKWWWAAATVVLLVLSTWAYFFPHKNHQNEAAKILVNDHVKDDVLPGGNKAVLTLGNGQKIILDSAANGILSQQGNAKVLKLGNGQLAYNTLRGKSNGQPAAILYNTLATPRGGQYQLTIPDGTRVWLNAASSIRYPTAFPGKDRTVSITGEAYFEVRHLEHQPFKVMVGDRTIEDVGTHFNVNAYTDEPAMKTTLLEGAVKVDDVELRPGEQASIGMQGQISVRKEVDVDEVVAWKNGAFAFTDADLPTVMRQLARWYNIEVEYTGHVPPGTFDGEIGRSLTLNQVLKVLTKTRIHYTIEGNKLTIQP